MPAVCRAGGCCGGTQPFNSEDRSFGQTPGIQYTKVEKPLDEKKKIVLNFKKICICRGITAGRIREAIRGGCLSFEALRRQIRVGTGNCKARRCRQNIEKMVKDHKETLKPPARQGLEPVLPVRLRRRVATGRKI